MKVLKYETFESHFSVLVEDTKEDIQVWMDVESDGHDIIADWNQYIFYLTDPRDLKAKEYQENIENFIDVESTALDYLSSKNLISY